MEVPGPGWSKNTKFSDRPRGHFRLDCSNSNPGSLAVAWTDGRLLDSWWVGRPPPHRASGDWPFIQGNWLCYSCCHPYYSPPSPHPMLYLCIGMSPVQRHFMNFCSCDLDIWTWPRYSVPAYQNLSELFWSRLSLVKGVTDRQTDAQTDATENITVPRSWMVMTATRVICVRGFRI